MLPWFNPTLASAERVTDVRDTSLSKLVKGDVLGLILSGVLVPGQRKIIDHLLEIARMARGIAKSDSSI